MWIAHRAAIASLLMLALSGCAASNTPHPSGFLDCGVDEAPAGAPNVEARTCLLEAFQAGTPAILESRLMTIEGDPIIRSYRVVSAAEVRIEHDARRDSWGSGTIEILSCPRLVPVEDWNRVNGDTMRAEEVFVEDGCQTIGTR